MSYNESKYLFNSALILLAFPSELKNCIFNCVIAPVV